MTMPAASQAPLTGIRVIELGSLIAGPYAGSLLAQFGADVIKVESPKGGDPLRKWRVMHEDTSLWWYSQSRNKRSVALDLREPQAQEVVRKLATTADIVIENFRPGALEKWGLGWDDLHALNPRLIMVRVSGYGQTGPYRERPGFAAIAESMGGMRNLAGYPDRPPVRTGLSIGDTLASLYGTLGAMMALHHLNQNHGTGQYVDVALYEAAFAVTESLIPEYTYNGHLRERSGASLPGIVPSSTYSCADGGYIIIAGNGDGIFKRLMVAIGREDLADDPELAHNDGRVRHTERIDQAISEWTEQRPLEHALQVLRSADVPCDRIYTAADIVADPQYAARGMLEPARLPDGTEFAIPGVVPQLSASPGGTRWLGPRLGEHTDTVLRELGYSDEDLARLREQGCIA